MTINDLTPEQKLEIITIVLRYIKYMLSDDCDPHLGNELWMELSDYFDKLNKEIK